MYKRFSCVARLLKVFVDVREIRLQKGIGNAAAVIVLVQPGDHFEQLVLRFLDTSVDAVWRGGSLDGYNDLVVRRESVANNQELEIQCVDNQRCYVRV